MRKQKYVYDVYSRPVYGRSRGVQRSVMDSTQLLQRLQLDVKLDVHNGCVNTIEWNETGSLLLSGSDDHNLVITNIFKPKPISTKIRTPHTANIISAKFLSGTGDSKLVSCADSTIIQTDINRPEQFYTLNCHSSKVYEVLSISGDSHSFLTCGEDGTVRWIDTRVHPECTDSTCQKEVIVQCDRGIGSISLNPLFPWELAVGSSDSCVRMYDRRMLSTKSVSTNYNSGLSGLFSKFSVPEFEGKTRRITSVKYRPDGREVLVSFSSDYLYVFNPKENCSNKSKRLKVGRPSKKWRQTQQQQHQQQHPKKFRLRGDWSDTGPRSRPESESVGAVSRSSDDQHAETARDRTASTQAALMQRMTFALSRMLNDPGTRLAMQRLGGNSSSRSNNNDNPDQSGDNNDNSDQSGDNNDNPYQSEEADQDPAPEPQNLEASSASIIQDRWRQYRERRLAYRRQEIIEVETSNDNLADSLLNPLINDEEDQSVEVEMPSEGQDQMIPDEGQGQVIIAEGQSDVIQSEGQDQINHSEGQDQAVPQEGQGPVILSEGQSETNLNENLAGDSQTDVGDSSINDRLPNNSLSLVNNHDNKECDNTTKNNTNTTKDDNINDASDCEDDNNNPTADESTAEAETAHEYNTRVWNLYDTPAEAHPIINSTAVVEDASNNAAEDDIVEYNDRRMEEDNTRDDMEELQSTYSNLVESGVQTNLQLRYSQEGANTSSIQLQSDHLPGPMRVVTAPGQSGVDPVTGARRRRIGVSSPPTSSIPLPGCWRPQEPHRHGSRTDEDSASASGESGDEVEGGKEEMDKGDIEYESDFSDDDETLDNEEESGHSSGGSPRGLPGRTILQPPVATKFTGHRNVKTLILEGAWWGDNTVLSGSDCGHFFAWDRHSSEILLMREADRHVVNRVRPHPFLPILATSGIDHDVKIWSPTACESEVSTTGEDVSVVIKRNEIMLDETRDTITVPASLMIRMLASLNQIRRGERQSSDT